MSAYYRKIKRICSEYEIISSEKIMLYWLSILFMAVSIVGFVQMIFQNSNSGGTTYIIIWIASFISSKYQSRKMDRARFEGIQTIIKNDVVSIFPVEYLISELENYLKNVKKIAQWSVGILSTLLVLLVNFAGNIFSKMLEVIFQSFERTQQQEIIQQLSKEINRGDDQIFAVGLFLLFTLSFLLLVSYCFFYVFTLKKKQILLILYDVRYCILSIGEDIESNKANE